MSSFQARVWSQQQLAYCPHSTVSGDQMQLTRRGTTTAGQEERRQLNTALHRFLKRLGQEPDRRTRHRYGGLSRHLERSRRCCEPIRRPLHAQVLGHGANGPDVADGILEHLIERAERTDRVAGVCQRVLEVLPQLRRGL